MKFLSVIIVLLFYLGVSASDIDLAFFLYVWERRPTWCIYSVIWVAM